MKTRVELGTDEVYEAIKEYVLKYMSSGKEATVELEDFDLHAVRGKPEIEVTCSVTFKEISGY